MAVHSYLGGGNFTENIYQRALLMDLQENGLTCESEIELPIFYKEKIIGKTNNHLQCKVGIDIDVRVRRANPRANRRRNQHTRCVRAAG